MRWPVGAGHDRRIVIPGLHDVILGLTGNLITVLLAVALAVSCGGDEPLEPTPPKDTDAPTITVSKSTVNVIAGPAVTISGSTLKIGDESVASWKDDKSTTCTVTLSFTSTSGTTKALNS